MSYKFKIGPAILSGSTVMKESLQVDDALSANSLSASGDVDAGGDLTAGTITMSGFAVDADGDTALKSLKVDDGSTIGSDSQVGMLTFAADGDLTFHDGAFDFDVASHDGVNGLKLGGILVTSDAGELNKLDGASADVTAAKLSKLSTLLDAEVDFLDGATDSGVASKAVIFDSDKDINGVRKLEASSELEAPKVKASTRLQAVSGGSIKAYLSSSGEVSGSGDLKIGGSAQFGGQIQVGTLFKMPTNTAGNILVGDGTSFEEVAMSGDVAIASNGATTIQSDAVEQSMIADDAVGADQLASNAVVNASIASNAAIDMDKLDGGSLAASLTDAAQTDLLYVGDDDGSGGFALKSITFSNFEDAIFGNVSGDATVAAGGALTIAADSVEGTMLNTNAADGSTLELSSDSLSVLKVPNALSQGDGIAAFSYDGSGALTVALSASVAGSGLAYAAGVLKVDIDEFSPLGSAALHQTQDKFLFSDNGVEKTITFSNLQDAVFAGVSGDASIAAGGALTIGSETVEFGMLNDNAISGHSELAAADIADADDIYGKTKAAGEVNSLNTLTIRWSLMGRELFNFTELFEWLVNNKNKNIDGYSRVLYSGITTVKMGKIINKILKQNINLTGIYNISSTAISKFELLHKLSDAFSLNVDITENKNIKSNKVLNSKKFAEITGIKTPDWDDLISEFVEDCGENKSLYKN